MRKNLLYILLLLAIFVQSEAFGQAGNWPGSTNRGTITPGNNTYVNSAATVGPGDYVGFNACDGVEYYFYGCVTGNWDVDYVLFNNGTGALLYNFDGQSACSWRADGDAGAADRYTSTLSGVVRVIMPHFNRSTASSANSWNWSSIGTGATCTLLGVKAIPESAPATPTGATTICDGGNATLTRSGAPAGAGITWYWQTSTGGTLLTNSGATFNTGALTATTTYYLRPRSCHGYWGTASGGVTVTVVADPSTPTATKSPNVTTVCEGQNLTLTGATHTGGGTGTCNFEYQIDGVGAWSTTVPNVTATVGTNTIGIRRLCNGNGCGASGVNLYSWTVVANPAISISGGSSPICSGGTFGTLSSSVSGGTGTLSYDWQRNINGGGWISVGTASTYATGTLTTTGSYQYRCLYSATGNACGTATSNTISHTVVANPAISISGGSSPICSGGTFGTLSSSVSGGTGTLSYDWQQNINGAGWVSVGTASTYATGTLTTSGTYQYRCVYSASGNGCTTATSNTISHTVVDNPAISISGGSSPICSGGTFGTLSSSVSGGTGTLSYSWQRNINGAGWVSVGTAATYATGTLTTTGTYQYRCLYSASGNGCTTATSNTISHTVVANPAAPTATMSPTATTVCEGQTLSLTSVTDNGGGTGTCNIEYSINGGAFSTTPASFTATVGSNSIAIRKNCSGNGCGVSSVTTYTWSVVDDPAVPTATKSPTAATVCAGQLLTLSGVTDNGGGTGTCSFEYSANGGAWTTTLPNFAATVGTNTIAVRRNCNGSGCDISGASTYSWTVVADPATPTGTKSPNLTTVCEGQTLTLTGVSAVSGGTGTCNVEYSINGGAYSTTPASFAATVGTNTIAIRSNCNGNGCDISGVSTYSWTVVADPVVTISGGTGTICEGSSAGNLSSSISGGIGAFGYQWQRNINGSGWTNLGTASTQTVGVLLSFGTYQYRLLVTDAGAGCDNPTSNVITIIVDQEPVISAPTTVCDITTAGVTANVGAITVSAGSWSGGTYTPPNLTPPTASQSVTITATNGTCVSTKNITVFNQPSITSSGSSMCEGETRTLTSNITGATFSGTGVSGGVFTAPNPGGISANYTITVTNGSCSDFQILTVYQNATITSSSADMCVGSSRALTASLGGGIWTGTGVSGSTFTAPNPTGNSQVYTISYTTIGSPCPTVTQDITVFKIPTTANAGPNQTGVATCGLTSVTLAANNPTVGTGSWSVQSGTGGSFGASGSPTSSFSGTAGSSYVLRWTISNGVCGSTTSDVTVTFNRNPTTASAGPDQTGASTCGLTSVTLAANTPSFGTGVWSVQSGAGGSFGAAGSPTSSFSGTAGSSYVLRWTISNSPCTASFSDVTVTFNRNPTTSNAGSNQTVCATTATLAGNNPTVGTGTWTLVSGTGTITTPGANNSGVTGLGVGANVFRWTISNGVCTASQTTVTITRSAQPTASAGGSTSICFGSSATVSGASSTNGTINWTHNGNGTITNPTSLTPTYNSVLLDAGNAVTLTMTVSNAPCTAATATYTVNVGVLATSNAGPDQVGASTCGLTIVTLAGNNPAPGAGLWTVVSGVGGSFGSATSPTSTFSGDAGSTYVLRWTTTLAPCPVATDDVTITFNQNPTTANAGVDFDACIGLPSTMSANNAEAGVGAWTWSPSAPTYSGGTDSTDREAEVTFAAAGTYTGTWTITNAPCTTSSDAVDVKVNAASTSVVLVSGTSITATEVCVESPWTYYANPASPDEYIFAIAKNGNSFTANIEITDQAGITPIASTGGVGPDRGTWLINRHWNVTLATGTISTPVDIRFYVDPAEVTAAQNAATAFLNSSPYATNLVGLTFFKTSGVAFSPSMMVGGDFTFTPQYLSHTTGTTNGITYYELTGLTSFSGGTGGFSVNDDGSTLPVELLGFKAKVVNNEYVQLDWSTATEVNNDGFELMRGTDGVNFERIAWIEGNGNSTAINSYNFEDTEVSKGITYYYQLKQVDYNGEFELFNIVTARLIGGRSFSIGSLVPNPSSANANVNVDVFSLTNEVISISIYNHVGVLVSSANKELFEGANNVKFGIDNLASGTYFINFQGSFGTETKKLIIVN